MRVAGIAVVLVPLAGACYFTTDFSGLAGSEPDAASGVPEAGATDADAATDADTATDAGPGDSSVEAAADFCAGATFCDQFERTSNVKGAWGKLDTSPGSTLALTTARARSGTSAMRMKIALTEPLRAYVAEQRTVSATKVRFEVSMYLQEPLDRGLNLPGLSFRYGTRSLSLYFLADTNVKVAEQEFDGAGETFFDGKATAPFVIGRWATLALDVDLGVTPQRMKASYDGKVMFDGALMRPCPPAPPEIVVGTAFARTGPTMTSIDFDDVRVDVTP
jgi:hypothetical protein